MGQSTRLARAGARQPGSGRGRQHVLCGGEDEDIADAEKRDALIERKAATLQRKLGKLLPRIDTTICYRWTGTFSETKTGLPIIGRIPGMLPQRVRNW